MSPQRSERSTNHRFVRYSVVLRQSSNPRCPHFHHQISRLRLRHLTDRPCPRICYQECTEFHKQFLPACGRLHRLFGLHTRNSTVALHHVKPVAQATVGLSRAVLHACQSRVQPDHGVACNLQNQRIRQNYTRGHHQWQLPSHPAHPHMEPLTIPGASREPLRAPRYLTRVYLYLQYRYRSHHAHEHRKPKGMQVSHPCQGYQRLALTSGLLAAVAGTSGYT